MSVRRAAGSDQTLWVKVESALSFRSEKNIFFRFMIFERVLGVEFKQFVDE